MSEAGNIGPATNPQRTPVRFWWLKRLTVATAVFFAALVGLRYWALAVAEKRLRAEIDAIHARGEPILPADFAEPPIPGEQNAAVDLLKAGRIFKVPPQHKQAWDALSVTAFGPRDIATIDAVLEANHEPLALARLARAKPGLNWELKLEGPGWFALPMVNDMRELNLALGFATRRAYAKGRHGDAVEYLRDSLSIARAMERQPVLVSHLVAENITDLASSTAGSMAPQLQVDRTGGGQAQGAASEAQIKALIADLLEHSRGQRGGWRWAMLGERMWQFVVGRAIAEGGFAPQQRAGQSPWDRVQMWWLKPLLLSFQPSLIAAASSDTNAADAPDLPNALAKMPTANPAGSSTQLDYMRTMRAPSLRGMFIRHFQSVQRRRATSIALAARLYEVKYGRRPSRVEDLVPEFLAAAPTDPLSGAGAVISLATSGMAPATAPSSRPVR